MLLKIGEFARLGSVSRRVAIGGPVNQIVNEDLLPVVNRAEEQFDTLGIRKLLAGTIAPFVTYYTEEPEGEFHGHEGYGLHRVVVLRGATSIDDADEQLFECQRPVRTPAA